MTPIKSSTTCCNGFFAPGQSTVSFWFPRRPRGPAVCYSIVRKDVPAVFCTKLNHSVLNYSKTQKWIVISVNRGFQMDADFKSRSNYVGWMNYLSQGIFLMSDNLVAFHQWKCKVSISFCVQHYSVCVQVLFDKHSYVSEMTTHQKKKKKWSS